MAQKVYMYVQL